MASVPPSVSEDSKCLSFSGFLFGEALNTIPVVYPVTQVPLTSYRPPRFKDSEKDINFITSEGVGHTIQEILKKKSASRPGSLEVPNGWSIEIIGHYRKLIHLRLMYPQYPHAELRVSFVMDGVWLNNKELYTEVARELVRCYDFIQMRNKQGLDFIQHDVPDVKDLVLARLQPMEKDVWNVVLEEENLFGPDPA